MSSMEQNKKGVSEFLDSVATIVDKASAIGTAVTGNPFLMAALSFLVKGAASLARRNGIDPGPFETRIASLESLVDRGLKQDEEYRQRHGQ